MLPSITALFLIGASSAEACSACVIALSDQYLPPISLWNGIAISWYLGTAAIASYFRVNVKYVPGLLAIGVVILGGLGTLMIGYPILLLLVIPSALAAVASVFGKTTTEIRPFRLAIRSLACVAILSISFATIKSVQIHRTRTDMGFILQWGDVAPALAIIESWKLQEPESLPKYRELIDRGRRMEVVVERAAERIAEIGDPTVDLPLLEAALKRCDTENWPDSCRQGLAPLLQKLRLRSPVKSGARIKQQG